MRMDKKKETTYWEFTDRHAGSISYWTWRRVGGELEYTSSRERFPTYGEVVLSAIQWGFDPSRQRHCVTTSTGTVWLQPDGRGSRARPEGPARLLRSSVYSHVLESADRRRGRRLLDAAIAGQGARKGNVQILGETGVLAIVLQRGFRRSFLKHFESVRLEEMSACGRAMKSGAPVCIADVQRDRLFAPHRAIAVASGFRAVQSIPLTDSRRNLIGVLSVHYTEPLTFAEWRLPKLLRSGKAMAAFLERVLASRTP